MRIVFMGTPDFAAVCLEAVYNHPAAEVVGVLTQPDTQKGRGMKFIPSPVKVFAMEHNIPVYQPETLKNGAFSEELARLDPELIFVAAYGKILPAYVLEYPKYGCINAHGSLLPLYRGASPIQRAIMDGHTRTGITAMYMADGIDTGDMLLKGECDILPEDDFGTLHDKLAAIAGDLLCQVIDKALDGTLEACRCKQDDNAATHAPKILKEDTILDFTKPACCLCCLIRGLSPAPLAMTKTPDGKLLKAAAAAVADQTHDAAPGTVLSLDDGILVACGEGTTLRLTSVVPEGKKRMDAADYIRGRKLNVGDLLAY
ncbi:MAG: methionyl-tRNA formyltransferase [Ruminococcaceae bacterium]|nr:methionyl-tRNA formyltransferase [Oscillospiraceae bacterium]